MRVVEGDIRDRAALAAVTAGIDLVYHLAAIRITRCAEEPRVALEVLADGTFNVLEAAVEAGVSRVVASSSASVYGQADVLPTDENHHPWNNDTIYGAAKAFNEGLLLSFRKMYDLDYVALRYFNVYGPRMDIYGVYTEVLVRWMERIEAGEPPLILGDGAQTMDLVHVSDVAKANVLAAGTPHVGETYNVATGTSTSLAELAAALSRVMGRARAGAGARPRAGHQRRALPPGRHLQGPRPARLHRLVPAGGRPGRPGQLVAGPPRPARGRALLSTPLAGSWDGLVVICASTPWQGRRLLDQALALELARHAPVLYVDPPVSLVGRMRAPTDAPAGPPAPPGRARPPQPHRAPAAPAAGREAAEPPAHPPGPHPSRRRAGRASRSAP